VGARRPSLADAAGHLDQQAVIERMIQACVHLGPVLRKDEEIIGALPYLQASWIAKALVDLSRDGQEACVRAVLGLVEQVLRDFGQDGRDFIGAGFVEGIPEGGEAILMPFAGPLLLEEMRLYL
jgi:hypothetical protein